jgi:hypothetical protein
MLILGALHIHTNMEIKWTPPPMDWCKANWDVALQKNAELVGIGVIVQDHNGRMVATRSFTKRGGFGAKN